MDDLKPDLSAALDAILAVPPSGAGAHPTPERLVDYHHDRLPADEADAIQEHLASCRLCADLLLELRKFTRVEQEFQGLVDLEEAAAWGRLSTALREEAEPAEPERSILPPSAIPVPRSRLVYGLAASLLISTVGLGIWAARLHGELAALRAPRANVSIVNLESVGFARGGRAPATTAAGRRVVLILNPASFPMAGSYGVEVVAPGGRRLWSGTGLVPTEAGNFLLELPEGLLVPGSCRIRLLRSGEEVASFDLRVTP